MSRIVPESSPTKTLLTAVLVLPAGPPTKRVLAKNATTRLLKVSVAKKEREKKTNTKRVLAKNATTRLLKVSAAKKEREKKTVPAISFVTAYNLATSITFLIKDTFAGGKTCAVLSNGGVDLTATPFAAIMNLGVLFVGYCGFMILYKSLLKTHPFFYVGGMGAYTLGYLVFGLSSALSWAAAVGDASGADAASGFLNVAGSALFVIGSLAYLHNTNSFAPWAAWDGQKSMAMNIFGPEASWYGSLAFLLGSLVFLAGTCMDVLAVAGSTPLYQAGILMFIMGRVFFLCPAVWALFEHKEFVYLGTGNEFKLKKVVRMIRRQSSVVNAFKTTKTGGTETNVVFISSPLVSVLKTAATAATATTTVLQVPVPAHLAPLPEPEPEP